MADCVFYNSQNKGDMNFYLSFSQLSVSNRTYSLLMDYNWC